MNKFRKKGFTLLESLFALIILSIISMVFISGIYQITKNKENNIKLVRNLDEIENILEKIKYNIDKKSYPLENIETDLMIKVTDISDMYHIIINSSIEGEEYEIYFKK